MALRGGGLIIEAWPRTVKTVEASKAAYQSALGQAITTEVAAASDYEQCFYYGEDYHRAPPPHPGARPAPALSPA